MTRTVISCEITFEKCICVSRTTVSPVPPIEKKSVISCKYECLGEVIVVTDPFC